MNLVSIARDGNVIGEWPMDEIPKLLQTGELRSSDHYWRTGMPDWQLLSHLPPATNWDLIRRIDPEKTFEKTVKISVRPPGASQKESHD